MTTRELLWEVKQANAYQMESGHMSLQSASVRPIVREMEQLEIFLLGPFCIFTLPQKTNTIVKFEDNKNETKIYAYGGKVKFSCKEGYELDGPKTVHCTSNRISIIGQWDSPFPTCKSIYAHEL